MPRHVDAWMDGVALSSLGPILISNVYEDAPEFDIMTGERPGRDGQRLLRIERLSLSVAIECVIRERFDLAARSRIVEEMARWSRGSVLELSNHPERRLNVYCISAPSLGTVRDYTSVVRMEFEADTVPFWEDVTPNVLTISGSSASGILAVPGTALAPVCLTVTPTGGTLTAFSVTAGGQTVSLSGLSVATSGSLVFERSARDDLAIRSGSASLLSKRSVLSADDLLAGPGRIAVSYTANTACDVRLSVRGRWA